MSPEEVAKRFHSECARPDPDTGNFELWCRTHEAMWRSGEYCDAMTDYVDLAEQAVEGYKADLRAEVVALRDEGSSGDDFDEGWSGACRSVIDMIDGNPDA